MTKKPIDRLYGLSFLILGLAVLVKYLNLFFLPNWVLHASLFGEQLPLWWRQFVIGKVPNEGWLYLW